MTPASSEAIGLQRAAARSRAVRARRRRRWGDRLVLYALAALAFVILAGPLLWMVSSSLKSPAEVLSNPPTLWPHELHWENYRDVFKQVPFARYLLNSLLVASVVTVVALLFHSMAAYSLARLRYPGRDKIFVAILMTLMVPFTVIAVPLFIIVDWLGWVDTYQGLIVPMIPHAFGIFLLRQFYLSIPRELEEAAIVDGANEFRIFARIYLPLARPAVATLALFVFMGTWDQLLWPMIVAPNPDMRTLQVGLAFVRQQAPVQNQVMAAIVLSVIPVVIAFLLTQRQFIAGIAAGAVKE
jgi:multiple sugar transport system permease protein